jgi:CRISPR/Cas system-associated exonuclease Cas4 (RecB family)
MGVQSRLQETQPYQCMPRHGKVHLAAESICNISLRTTTPPDRNQWHCASCPFGQPLR